MSIETLFGEGKNAMLMHGTRNKMIVIKDFEEEITPEIVRRLTDSTDKVINRGGGVNTDGVIAVRYPRQNIGYTADFRMVFFNPDGTIAEMCGNGIRCESKWLVDNSYWDVGKPMRIDTDKGLVVTEVLSNNRTEAQVMVNMGQISLYNPEQVALKPGSDGIVRFLTHRDAPNLKFSTRGIYICVGNPHMVFIDQVARGTEEEHVYKFGRDVEWYTSVFPQKTNVEFATVNNRNDITMRVWERGAGPTAACGTGACATVGAARLEGKVDENVTVHLPGGDLQISWEGRGKPIYMTGNAVNICELGRIGGYLF